MYIPLENSHQLICEFFTFIKLELRKFKISHYLQPETTSKAFFSSFNFINGDQVWEFIWDIGLISGRKQRQQIHCTLTYASKFLKTVQDL